MITGPDLLYIYIICDLGNSPSLKWWGPPSPRRVSAPRLTPSCHAAPHGAAAAYVPVSDFVMQNLRIMDGFIRVSDPSQSQGHMPMKRVVTRGGRGGGGGKEKE